MEPENSFPKLPAIKEEATLNFFDDQEDYLRNQYKNTLKKKRSLTYDSELNNCSTKN